MKVLRLISLIAVLTFVFASSAAAQDGPWQVSFNGGAVVPMGNGDSIGDAGPKPLLLKQRTGFTFGGTVGRMPDDAWGFQVRGYHFGTKATDINGVLDAGTLLTYWGVNPDVRLVCSAKSVCNNGPNSYEASGSESRTRLDFLAVRSFSADQKVRRLFVGLAYLNQRRDRVQSGAWPNTILDIPSQVVISERVDISTMSRTTFSGFGPIVGAEVEHCLGDSFFLNMRGQLAWFFGTASNSGGFEFNKAGTLSNGLGGFNLPTVRHPLTGGDSVRPRELDLGVSLRYLLGEGNSSLGFGVGYLRMSGLPTAEYVVPAGRAAVFGDWQTGKATTSHVRLVGIYVVRF